MYMTFKNNIHKIIFIKILCFLIYTHMHSIYVHNIYAINVKKHGREGFKSTSGEYLLQGRERDKWVCIGLLI